MRGVRRRVGERVRQLRAATGLTQEQLAERSGLSQKFIGEIERGQANPTIETLERLCAALGVPIGELFGGDDAARQDTYVIPERSLHAVREALANAEGVLADVETRQRRRQRKR